MQMNKRLGAALVGVLVGCALAVSACSNLNEYSGGPYINGSTSSAPHSEPPATTTAIESGEGGAGNTSGEGGAGGAPAQRPTAGPPEFNVIDTYTNTVTRQ